jgi:hypothetical protein
MIKMKVLYYKEDVAFGKTEYTSGAKIAFIFIGLDPEPEKVDKLILKR